MKFIGVGIVSILIVQTFVHIGVNVQILPNTGVTLPFVSAGGSSLFIACVKLMILYKILKSEEKKSLVSNI
jgi:cell division protein FtsW (lipid II flippase)